MLFGCARGALALLAALAPTTCFAQLVLLDPVTITFDEEPVSGNPDLTMLSVAGFVVASDHFHVIGDPAGGVLPLVENGSQFAFEEAGGLGDPIRISRADGLPFALVAYDVAEGFLSDQGALNEGFPNATFVRLIGSGSECGYTLDNLLDAVKDGPGPLDDFQSIALPSESAECLVDYVQFEGRTAAGRGAIAIDNVVARPAAIIPEPGAAALACAAVLTSLAVRPLSTGRFRWRSSTGPG
jgi:hypothetical protein